MPDPSEPLESRYASNTLGGLIRSGFSLLAARRIRPRTRWWVRRLHLRNLPDYLLYAVLIVVPAIILEVYQRCRSLLTGKPREHPSGSWQYYLQTGLREDSAHHTNETTGYHKRRPSTATEIDDLTAWVMAVIQFLWNYDDLMGVVWDEWTMLRLVGKAAQQAGLQNEAGFNRLQRQWELARPYSAPLNGTYADVRQAAFDAFITPRLEVLPAAMQAAIRMEYAQCAGAERGAYQRQMSLLASLKPGRFIDAKQPLALWQTRIGLIINGQYYTLDIAEHDANGAPIVYGRNGHPTRLASQNDYPTPTLSNGEPVIVEGDAVTRLSDGEWVGHLAMVPAARIKWQLREILEEARSRGRESSDVDILLAEAPRKAQRELRTLLPETTQRSLEELAHAPVILNWDEQPGNSTLAEVRRAQRGVGDHALTIIRTDHSFIFDQSHIFFDGTWSLAMAEVLTNAAVRWCERCTTLTPTASNPARHLGMEPSPEFVARAAALQRPVEISAETTIWDISNIFTLRRLLARMNTLLTVNDLLVITRIFHAAHYEPSAEVRQSVDALFLTERRAARAIRRAVNRGRVTNPALLIPVDASPTDPHQRIYPITFRNLADDLVRVWDDTWQAYQAYRRIEPPDTPEGIAAYEQFARQRTLLVGNLRDFSHILDASKNVAIRGNSVNIAILRLLVGLPLWLQTLLKEIPERVLALNEVIRGDEVYSNVGRVAQGSTLSRFMTAKDDGNTKALAWGVMTDDNGRLIVTMRDFRPHVEPLLEAGHEELAHALAQDYVSSYTADLIGLVARLSAMLQAKDPQAQHTRDTILEQKRG